MHTTNDPSMKARQVLALILFLSVLILAGRAFAIGEASRAAEQLPSPAAAETTSYEKVAILQRPNGVSGNVRSVAATTGYAYLLTTAGTLVTYDISSVMPGSLVTLDTPLLTQSVENGNGLLRDGSTLYLYGGGGVQPVDISQPDAPVVGPSNDDAGVPIYNAILHDGYLIGAAYQAVVVYSLGESGPVLVENAPLGPNRGYSVGILAEGVLLAGHFALSGGVTGYSIFEYGTLEDLGDPVSTTASSLTYHLELFGDRLVGCTDNTLRLYDVSTPTVPAFLTSVSVNSARACIRDGENLVTNGHVHTISGDAFTLVDTFIQDNTLSDGFPYVGTVDGDFVFLPQTSRVLVLHREPPDPPPGPAPEFELVPDWGGLGTFVGARSLPADGSSCDWQPGELVELWWDDPEVKLVTFAADANGCFEGLVNLSETEQLAGSLPGNHKVLAKGAASVDGQANFEQVEPGLQVSPHEGPGKLPVGIEGCGWDGLPTVNVFWFSTGELVGKANVDGVTGCFNGAGTIVASRTEGFHVLVATGEPGIDPGERPANSSAAVYWLKNPTIQLTPPEGPPGARVPIAGCNWFPNEVIEFSWSTESSAFDALETDQTGCIKPITVDPDPWPDPWLRIPVTATLGVKAIRADGLTSEFGLQVPFEVISRTLTFTPASGQPGDTIEVAGCGWVGNNKVTVEWGYPDTNGLAIRWDADVDAASGCFARQIDVPDNTPTMIVTATAEGDNDGEASGDFTVEHGGAINIPSQSEDVEAGGSVEIFVTGGIVGESINFLWDDTTVIHSAGVVTPDFSTVAPIPAEASTGYHTIRADGSKGFDAADQVYVVDLSTVGVATPGPLYPGMTIQVTGDKWASTELVGFGLRGSDFSFVYLGSATVAGDSHSFSTELTLPADLELPGSSSEVAFTLEADGDKGRDAETGLTVTRPPEPAFDLVAGYADPAPVLDGQLAAGEWKYSGVALFANGYLSVRSDENRLYVLLNVLGDDQDDGQGEGKDNFWLSFDLSGNRLIDSDVDLNFRLDASGELILESYQGPGSLLKEPVAFMRSAFAGGFGCFFADGSLTLAASPLFFDCDSHRLWEIGIDLRTIGAEPGDTVRMGVRSQSAQPAFQDDLPADFTTDFDHFGQIRLADSRLSQTLPDGQVTGIGVGGFDIEVTQAVQELDNSLGLVADKDTAVRVFPSVASTATVRVFLYGERAGEALPGSPLVSLATIPPPAQLDRGKLEDAANFLLPASWRSAGATEFIAIAESYDGFSASAASRAVAFTAKRPLVIWTIPINQGTEETPVLPDPAAVARQESVLQTMFPIAEVEWVRRDWTVVGTNDTITTSVAKQMVKDYYTALELSWAMSSAPVQRPDIVYGHLRNCDDDGTIGTSDPVWSGGEGVVAVGCHTDAKRANMAHEVNHNLDRRVRSLATWGRHIGGCGAEQGDANWPFLTGSMTTTINSVGFDPRLPWLISKGNVEQTVFPADFSEFMSYCRESTNASQPTQWISAYRWGEMFNTFAAPSALSSQAAGQTDAVDAIYISGRLYPDGSGALDPVLFQPGFPTALISPGDYSLELQTAEGAVLASVPFFATFIDVEGNSLDEVGFDYRLAAQPGVAQIVLKHGEQVLDTRVASANAPTVDVVTPMGGESWDEGGLVEWQAGDVDGDPLTFNLFYSPDNGGSWYPIASGLSGDSYAVNTGNLPGGDQGKIRVIASDGFHIGQADSGGFFSVPEPPALVSIHSPDEGFVYSADEWIDFQGSANKADGQSFAEEALVWYVNGQPGGVGSALQLQLPAGKHQISLRAIDDGNVAGEASTIIEVQPPGGWLRSFAPLIVR
jgi:hypothetical protein